MKVRISTISPDGLKIKDTIPLDALNARMNEGRDNDIEFTTAPAVDVVVYRTGGGAEIKGTITTNYRQPCGYCLDPIEQSLQKNVHMILAPRPSEKDLMPGEKEEDFQEDVGIYYYEGDHLDLEEPLQEALILSLSPFWRPTIDDKGCCGKCGKKFSAGQEHEPPPTINLGVLLKKAQEKKK